jgi:uncharacterized cupin superfamily protein
VREARKWRAMTSWLEPLGRGRGALSRPERRPRMAGRVTAPGTVQVGPMSALQGTGKARSPLPAAGGYPDAPRRFQAIFAAMNASIVRLDAPLEPDVSVPGADRLLAGAPEHRVWNYFTDSTQTFFAGRWSGTRGKWRVRYTENELCVMTAGRVVITSDIGESSAFGPGDAFVVPAGFSGTWEVLEDCSKVYAIFEPRT